MPTGPTGPASTASAEPTRGGSGVTSRPSSRELIARQASRTGNHAGPLHEAGRVSKAGACWACDACAGCPPRLPTFGSRTMTSRTGRNPRVRTTTEQPEQPIELNVLGFIPRRTFTMPDDRTGPYRRCLLYTSDAADEEDSVDLGG